MIDQLFSTASRYPPAKFGNHPLRRNPQAIVPLPSQLPGYRRVFLHLFLMLPQPLPESPPETNQSFYRLSYKRTPDLCHSFTCSRTKNVLRLFSHNLQTSRTLFICLRLTCPVGECCCRPKDRSRVTTTRRTLAKRHVTRSILCIEVVEPINRVTLCLTHSKAKRVSIYPGNFAFLLLTLINLFRLIAISLDVCGYLLIKVSDAHKNIALTFSFDDQQKQILTKKISSFFLKTKISRSSPP